MEREMSEGGNTEVFNTTALWQDREHSNSPERIKEIRAEVEGIRARSENGHVNRDALEAIFKQRSFALVGQGSESGKPEIVLVTPQFSVKEWGDVEKIQKVADSRLKYSVNNAVRAGMLSPERGDEIIKGIDNKIEHAHVRFQNLDKLSVRSQPPELSFLGQDKTENKPREESKFLAGPVMSRRAFVLGSAASTIFGLVTAGCQIVPTHVTETPAQIPTETKVPASTVTSTPENTTTPTEAATLNPEQIIDGRISDFLNGRGDFSDAALKDKIFLSSDHKLYPNEQITDDLGVLENDNQAAVAQGIILGSEIQGDNVIVIVGTKNYEGKRIVIPFYNNNVTFKIGGVELLFYNNGSYIGYSHDESMIFNNMEDYNDLLNKNIGNPIGFNLVLDSGFYSKVDEANFDKAVLPQALKNGYTTNDVHNVFTSMVNDIAIEKKIYPELYKCYQKWASVNADESKDITIINSMADIKNGIDPLKTSQLWVASIIGDDGK